MASNGDSNGTSTLLWEHANPTSTQLHAFLQHINKVHHKDFKTYHDLYAWSIEDVPSFWASVYQYVGIRASKPYKSVVSDPKKMFPRPQWFAGAEMNFAENLLFPVLGPEDVRTEVDPESPAVVAATETTRETVTWKELRERVRECQSGMKALGLKKGDRVAGYVAIIPMLLWLCWLLRVWAQYGQL